MRFPKVLSYLDFTVNVHTLRFLTPCPQDQDRTNKSTRRKGQKRYQSETLRPIGSKGTIREANITEREKVYKRREEKRREEKRT